MKPSRAIHHLQIDGQLILTPTDENIDLSNTPVTPVKKPSTNKKDVQTLIQQHIQKNITLSQQIDKIKQQVTKVTQHAQKKLSSHIFTNNGNTDMYRFDIAVLAPHAVDSQCSYLNNGMPECPECQSTLTTKCAGWHDKYFNIYNLNRSMILVVQRYKCTNAACIMGTHERTFCLSNNDNFDKLPDSLKQEIGFYHIGSYWYTRQFINYLVEHRLLMSLDNIRTNIEKSITNEFTHRKNLYCQSFVNTNQAVPYTPESAFTNEYGEENIPVVNTLNSIYMKCVQLLKGDAIEQHFNSLTSDYYMADHCFSAMSNVYYMAENKSKIQPFEALYTIMCAKTHMVMRWGFVTSTAHELTIPLWQAVANQHRQLGVSEPTAICVDNCCQDRSQYKSVFLGTKVGLDTFHAMCRIHRSLQSISHPQFAQCAHELKEVFYGPKSKNEKRPMLLQHIMLQRYDEWTKRWSNAPLPPKSNTKLFTTRTPNEIENLRSHIVNGCLNNCDTDEYNSSIFDEANNEIARMESISLMDTIDVTTKKRKSYNTTSPLEGLHSRLKKQFSGGAPESINIWLKHWFYEYNLRRMKQFNITIPIYNKQYTLYKKPKQNTLLNHFGLTLKPTNNELSKIMLSSTDQITQLITDAELTDPRLLQEFDRTTNLLLESFPASHYSTPLYQRKSALEFLEEHKIPYNNTTDDFELHEYTLFKYLYHHSEYRMLFLNHDYEGITSLWNTIILKLKQQTSAKSLRYNAKSLTGITHKFVQLISYVEPNRVIFDQVKVEESLVEQIYNKMKQYTESQKKLHYTEREITLMHIYTKYMSNAWTTIHAEWHNQIKSDIRNGFIQLNFNTQSITMWPRKYDALKQWYHTFKKEQQQFAIEKRNNQINDIVDKKYNIVHHLIQHNIQQMNTTTSTSQTTTTTTTTVNTKSITTKKTKQQQSLTQPLQSYFCDLVVKHLTAHNNDMNAVAAAVECNSDPKLNHITWTNVNVSSAWSRYKSDKYKKQKKSK